ncbi:MAG: phosphoglycerate kinase [Candidatus Tectomicrobia bacterium]|uniref:Phosphoglycerate kinase n=1 Tax=Tectimicrobiota bacterium TaxID=2528274 RepID=A0A932I0S4_UNCTE|nr:phosphoglycerate kinase [Candidatus Tectomicrobia bacterium]
MGNITSAIENGASKLTVEDVEVAGKRVLLRVDFNVPLDDQGNITDDTRIRAVLPTINYLLDEGAKVLIASHLGRPKSKPDPRYSLAPAAKRLSRLLEKDCPLAPDCVGPETRASVDQMKPGSVLVLENLRFHEGEERNADDFARELASLAEVYISDAFGNAHRNHASMSAVTKFLQPAAAGYLMMKEVNYLSRAVNNPMRPVVAILGGAKASSKLTIIERLLTKMDKIIIGGGMAGTFQKAMGYEMGNSLVEDNLLDTARAVMQKARELGVRFYLPCDYVVADKFEASAETKVVPAQEVPKDWYALDIGPASTTLFAEALQGAKTIIWNGPMGVFEVDAFSRGTYALVSHVANSYALTIVGGGDTDVAVHAAGESRRISYISTGGGAFLELLEGKELPGLASLTDKH